MKTVQNIHSVDHCHCVPVADFDKVKDKLPRPVERIQCFFVVLTSLTDYWLVFYRYNEINDRWISLQTLLDHIDSPCEQVLRETRCKAHWTVRHKDMFFGARLKIVRHKCKHSVIYYTIRYLMSLRNIFNVDMYLSRDYEKRIVFHWMEFAWWCTHSKPWCEEAIDYYNIIYKQNVYSSHPFHLYIPRLLSV